MYITIVNCVVIMYTEYLLGSCGQNAGAVDNSALIACLPATRDVMGVDRQITGTDRRSTGQTDRTEETDGGQQESQTCSGDRQPIIRIDRQITGIEGWTEGQTGR